MSKPVAKILYSVILGIGLGLIVSATILGVKLSLHGKLPPGTVIANMDVGYKTAEEAIQGIKEKEEAFFSKQLRFYLQVEGEAEPRETTVGPEEIDVEYFIDETIRTIDRMDLRVNSLPTELKRAQNSIEILYTFNADKLKKLLNEKLNLEEIAPQNANFYINEESNLDILEEKSGLLVDTEGFLTEAKNAISKMNQVNVELLASPTAPTVTKEELEAFREEVVEKLHHNVRINHEEGRWDFLPIHHLSSIEFSDSNYIELPYLNKGIEIESRYLPDFLEQSKKTVKIILKQEGLNKFIDEYLVESVEIEVDPVSIYKDEEGDVVIDGQGRDGIAVQRGSLKKSIELAINNEIDAVEVYTKTTKAPITISKELQDMGVKELIGFGHTTFYGSPTNRVHNIGVGLDQFTGTLIAPDEEFSFNEGLGRVDNTTGYRKELVITAKGTIPEYGGGLCQVSTTVYRAAIFSGLPITARAPHSYAVSYYSQLIGYGLDATIYLGGQDLKFLNDTGEHILVHSYTDGKHAYVKFYGTSDGRTVTLDGPEISNYRYPPQEVIYETSNELAAGETKQVERKHTGFDALWYRTISYPGGEEKIEEIFSHYKTTQEKYLVGPG
jgi:vancomycin resistance protein YoaR